jgi:pimeloyl-ACP methyl ester carboxylesterase
MFTARTINYTMYASRGYLVFAPDIPYRTGYPGESAYNAIVSGVTALIGKGFVDPERVGLQGHSWGGYQAAYLVTRTNLVCLCRSRRPGGQHDLGLWRHPLGIGAEPAVPVRTPAKPHRRLVVGIPDAIPRKFAAFFPADKYRPLC